MRPLPLFLRIRYYKGETMDEKIIELKGVSREYDETLAVDNIDLYVKKGEFIAFLGPSGCG